MHTLAPGALAEYGWSDRVLALFNQILGTLPPGAGPGGEIAPARVVRVERARCVAAFPDGAERLLRAPRLPAVGDWVLAREGDLHQVLERWSALVRVDPDPTGVGTQVLAANVDLVLIAVPADRVNTARADREIAIAWDSGARPVVVLTKADLAGPGRVEELGRRLVGVEVVAASTVSGLGIGELRALLVPSRTAVFIGPSGAGKSSLANSVIGSAGNLPVGQVRKADGRGRHTTTWRELVKVPTGGVIIDTPGLRSLGLTRDATASGAFADIEELAEYCRFSDCHHTGEPGCAVALAVAAGDLARERLDSFVKLQREIAAERRRTDPLARQAERRLWKERTKLTRSYDKRRPHPPSQ